MHKHCMRFMLKIKELPLADTGAEVLRIIQKASRAYDYSPA